ncbi:MAG: hypothetical protein PHW24_04735, partial [Candidatus Moranbacteria bacterium]|nr:hypothetical protein [Candidatus Moranbacteria bacterium]
MRLKTFFFPIVLVMAIAIFFGFIWPQIGTIKQIKADMAAKNVELGAIQEKQAAIETLGNQLTDSSNREVSVKNYLPENKVEERIIASINYLAGDANVSLADVSMGGVSTVVAPPVVVDPNVPVSTPASLVKTTSAKISLVGNYEKIRIFLDGLAHMPIFNTVKSLDITKQIPEKKDGVAVDDGT